jgi:hypothetical protein
MLNALIPIVAVCSLFTHAAPGTTTAVSFIDIRDSAIRASPCGYDAQDLHGWADYYWSTKPVPRGWQNDAVACTVLWPAYSGVDSVLILVRSNKPDHDPVALKICAKLAK